MPVSAMSLSRAQTLTFTDSSNGRFMLIQVVGGCLCVYFHPHFCVFSMLICDTSLPPSSITATTHILCVRVESQGP